MKSRFLIVAFAWLSCQNLTFASDLGLAYNQNFVVTAATGKIAKKVAAQADLYRRQIAKKWLGRRLPDGVQRTNITVTLSKTEDRGRTWPIRSPRRSNHTIYLTSSADRVSGSTLKHEVAHVVLATHFGIHGRLPTWLEEGIASQYDDNRRQKIRNEFVSSRLGTTETQLSSLFRTKSIAASRVGTYSLAESLTRYLMSKGKTMPGRPADRLFAFAAEAKSSGWDRALRRNYNIDGVVTLQKDWQRWVRAKRSRLSNASATAEAARK